MKTLSQKDLRENPDLAEGWRGRMVHIETENGVWRTGGSGYTRVYSADAWVLPFSEAVRQVSHCGPEKQARFIEYPVPLPKGIPSRRVAGRTLEEWRELSRRDDCLDRLVPSDVRELVSAIDWRSL